MMTVDQTRNGLDELEPRRHARERERRDELIVSELPLVRAWAAAYAASAAEYVAMRRVAELAVVRAAEHFDLHGELAFHTVANTAIRVELGHYSESVGPEDAEPRDPDPVAPTSEGQRELSSVIGRRPRIQELAHHLGCDIDAIVWGLQSNVDCLLAIDETSSNITHDGGFEISPASGGRRGARRRLDRGGTQRSPNRLIER